MSISDDYIQVITTTESKESAEEIAKSILSARLAGCVQIIGPITSYYWWKGKIDTAQEFLCLIKTKKSVYNRLEEHIKEIHPYELPEIIASPISTGSNDYLNWLNIEIKRK